MHTSVHNDNSVRWLLDTQAIEQRSFYSIRFIRVGGRCFCSGHADKCKNDDDENKLPDCKCQHNTCGRNCEKCCPLYNQRLYRSGTIDNDNVCEKCECHGHATECRYDAEIEKNGLSQNVVGEMKGGGVCINCTVKLFFSIE